MNQRGRAHRLALAGLLAAAASAGCSRRALYYEDGTKRSDGRVAWTSGREEGSWSYWFQNGERRESGAFRDGHRTGSWTQWYPNGQRRARGDRAWNAETGASEREGPWTFWHENGEIRARGVYRAGKREGHWEFALDDGTLDGDQVGEYHDDRKID